jgi:hypothetical protein
VLFTDDRKTCYAPRCHNGTEIRSPFLLLVQYEGKSLTVGETVPNNILLDEPAANPALGCGITAHALGQIIQDSKPPQFAVGIFGGWGSGKTTLMDAIKDNIKAATSLVTVEFNAWQYEREPQLLVPLLDTMRAALISWAKDKDEEKQDWVRKSAARIGRVVRALAKGLSVGVGLPGAVTANYDLDTALSALSEELNPESAQSVYYAAFQELKKSFDEFKKGGVTRVVVFVDDIDRCLPENALQVLESMKLFFDIEGFIFIVGLDPDVVGRAVQSKFLRLEEGRDNPGSSSSVIAGRLAREYIQKIFQVQYRVPPVYPQQLGELLGSMLGTEAQELKDTVLPYLEHLATDGRMNPREVKRLINDFILDTIISDSAQDKHIKLALRPDTMLALRILQFPYEWTLLYNALLTNPGEFQAALKKYKNGDADAFASLMPQLESLPESAKKFLRSPEADPLIGPSDLRPYLSSVKSVNIFTWFRGAMELFNAIIRAVDQARDDNPRDPLAALRVAQATLSDPAMDLVTYFSTAESELPAEFHALQRAIERLRRASSEEVDERVASELPRNIIFEAAKALLAAVPPPY